LITLTETAAGRLQQVMDEKGMGESHGLRVFVKGGGCGGMQYGMTFEEQARDGDDVSQQHGMAIFVDPTSSFYVGGAHIDYVDSLMGGGFHIENPNAVSTCGCGSSFRTEEGQEQAGGGAGCGSHG
jgi:iron-sulfur cluster assembly protein